jgi:hypothetical protein
MKHKPRPTKWAALPLAVAGRGPVGIIATVLVIVLACVVIGTPANVIYALAALIGAVVLLIVVLRR